MTEPLGFVVLARRPSPLIKGEWRDEIVSAVFPAYPNGLEQAQNALEACRQREERERARSIELDYDWGESPEFVIGAITERTP